MHLYKSLVVFMDSNGFLWVVIGPYSSLLFLIGPYSFFYVCMDFNVSLSVFIGLHAYL